MSRLSRPLLIAGLVYLAGCGDVGLYSPTCDGYFSEADVNKDRQLDENEQKAFKWPRSLMSPGPDIDHDGLWRHSETCGELAATFSRFDANKSDAIEGEEFYRHQGSWKACENLDPRCAPNRAEVDALFARTDIDRSGGLDLYEFAHVDRVDPKVPKSPAPAPSPASSTRPSASPSPSPSPAGSASPKPSPTAVVGPINQG